MKIYVIEFSIGEAKWISNTAFTSRVEALRAATEEVISTSKINNYEIKKVYLIEE